MSDDHPDIVNVDDATETERFQGERMGAAFKPMTPSMRPRGGKLGVNHMRVPPGRAAVPFHAHQREDEVFYILSGRGLFRYGTRVRMVRAGDCISCPAGSGEAHQLANPFREDLVYLAIGTHDPDEVCTYPDSDKVMVRSLGKVGHLEKKGYFDGEPDNPKIFELTVTEGR